jgi:hypothetical protein
MPLLIRGIYGNIKIYYLVYYYNGIHKEIEITNYDFDHRQILSLIKFYRNRFEYFK